MIIKQNHLYQINQNIFNSQYSTLAKGSFGTVYKGVFRGQEIAIKELSASIGEDSYNPIENTLTKTQYTEDVSEVKKEINLMSKLRSIYIVNFIGVSITRAHTYMLMEYCRFGSVKSLFKQKKLSDTLKLDIAMDCARGMQYLHSNKVIHRDLKCDNLLLISLSHHTGLRAKISDFGTSKMISRTDFSKTMTKDVGTPAYVAPEIINGEAYSLPCDVYSYAILLWALWEEAEPYEEFKNAFKIQEFVSSGERISIDPKNIFSLLIEQCWEQEPAERPDFGEIIDELIAIQKQRRRQKNSAKKTQSLQGDLESVDSSFKNDNNIRVAESLNFDFRGSSSVASSDLKYVESIEFLNPEVMSDKKHLSNKKKNVEPSNCSSDINTNKEAEI